MYGRARFLKTKIDRKKSQIKVVECILCCLQLLFDTSFFILYRYWETISTIYMMACLQRYIDTHTHIYLIRLIHTYTFNSQKYCFLFLINSIPRMKIFIVPANHWIIFSSIQMRITCNILVDWVRFAISEVAYPWTSLYVDTYRVFMIFFFY